MNENKVKGEKGALLIAATALLTKGIEAVTNNNFEIGIVCIIMSIAIFYIREHYKFRRWKEVRR